MTLPTLTQALLLLSGLCWTLVYLDGIRVGVRDRSYAIPFWALALNLAWEGLSAVLEYRASGPVLQVWISAAWFLFDLGILWTYLRFGRQEFAQSVATRWFLPWSLLVLGVAFVIQTGFILEFGFFIGRAYAAFLQNLLMSVLFIAMLIRRGDHRGQSRTIAISKWLGTLAPTMLFGVVGTEVFGGTNGLILLLGLLCSVFDLLYIAMLWQPAFWAPRQSCKQRYPAPHERIRADSAGSLKTT